MSTKYKNSHKNSPAHTGMGATGIKHGLNAESGTSTRFQWAPFSGGGGSAGTNDASSAAQQAANVVRQAYENTKRQREEAQAAAKREESLCRKLLRRNARNHGNFYTGFGADICSTRTCVGDDSAKNDSGEKVSSNARCSTSTVPEWGKGTLFYGDSLRSRLSPRSNSFNKDFSQVNAKVLLMEKARAQLLKKIQELNTAEHSKTKDSDMPMKKQKSKDIKHTVHWETSDVKAIDGSRSRNGEVPFKEVCQNVGVGAGDSDKTTNQPLSIDVPDSDFYDFDKDRSEKAFGDDQVWATYDDDGMPRYYAYIQKVISAKPFKVRKSFLTSKSNVEFGSLDWVTRGFCKTCGDFRIARYTFINTINILSHKIAWEKGLRGVIKVIPRKGNIWALYRNWCPEWNEHTTEDVIHKYEMVEVLEDYNEDQGILVVPLVKVSGFKTVFLRHMDPKEHKKIPREEMFRLSHQVPFYLLTGKEGNNAPKDCLELDPAATPLELLQVLTEMKEEELKNVVEQKSIT